jgi:hypothetical protein
MIGKTFGLLTVESEIQKKSPTDKRYRTHYACRCSCGARRITTKFHLTSGHLKSCGCLKKLCNTRSKTWKGCGDISGKYWSNLKHHANLRQLKFNITIEEAWSLFEKQSKRCALSGVELSFKFRDNIPEGTASLDRIDSTKGYEINNVQWIHKDINWMKNNFSQTQFLDWVGKIASYKLGYHRIFSNSTI